MAAKKNSVWAWSRTGLRGALCLTAALSGQAAKGADAGAHEPSAPLPPAAEQGRTLFNGKGLCSTCHGIDGYRDRLPPQLSPNIRENIGRLDPPPADLRRAETLTLTTDKQRFEAIRHGHLRTAMYPLSKESLSDEEILSLLPYLAALRGTARAAAPMGGTGDGSSLQGDAKSGRTLYHEIGGCAVCHGIEGHLNRKPPISADLSKRLSRLAVPPANLRDPAKLKAQDDEDRYRSIKLGHPGTAMYPKNLLRDEDIRDLIAYLRTLREATR
ncbi:MAG: cytochrome c [Nitrospira sp.]|nr:MAG: cytochrome c [Nitrospira sp.]